MPPDFLSAPLRRELRELMPADIAGDLADKFLNHSAFAAQNCFNWEGKVAPAVRLKQLRKVEELCHALVLALDELSDECVSELGDAAIRMVHQPSQPFATPGRRIVTTRLAELWDLAQDLEAMAELAAQRQRKPAKQTRPARAAAKTLAHDVALAYFEVFDNKWPPIGDGWFQSFVKRLGAEVGLSCGPKLVNVALKGRPVIIQGSASGR